MSERDDAPHDFSRAVLQPVSGYQAVAGFLRREMALGRIRPGDRLPPERRLSEQLGVSRETLRQALRILEGSGQIVISRGASGGAIVQDAALDPRLIREEVRTRSGEIGELTEFRAIVESGGAALAAVRRSDDDLEAMAQAQRDLAEAATKAESRIADTDFHIALAEASGNSFVRDAVEEARVRMFEPVDLISFDFVKESSWDAHEQILEAVRRGDAAAADAAMRAHLQTTREEFTRVVES
ncbi:FCD domain-containing protein [Microbacterium luteolum]|jgi:GntR family transcriptional repressor for pyruvate dehydrogenase complex|uniref:FCD domain-containing protein n=2 Tax=Microbacterium TaxID=33882 RepID=A0AAU7VUK2_9MICO|nr:FCD domain-containing protein [Microbacterium luteolum]WDM42297.1 FCD domain-containing protein [Microbacterium luteolum]